MIRPDDRLALPDGVELIDGRLVDEAREHPIPLNQSAQLALRSPTAAAGARAVAAHFGVDEKRAASDVLAFARELNARFALNASPRCGTIAFALRWLVALPLLLPRGVMPTAPATRRRVDTSAPGRLVRTSAHALAPVACVYGAGATSFALVAFAPLGGDIATAAAAGCAAGVGLVVHELGHLCALARVPACVVVRGFAVKVVHRHVAARRARTVAIAGPTAGVAAAALASAATLVAPAPELAASAGVLALQALGFTVATQDGRRACGLR